MTNLKIMLAATVMATATAAQAAPTTPCPTIGSSAGCSVVITANANGTFSQFSTGIGPYDGSDDTLVGVVNAGAGYLTSLTLSSSTDIFGFDGDGLAAYPGGATYGPTGYEGPNTSFTVVDAFHGTVNFLNGGIAPGGSAYFSLEDDLSGTSGGTTTPINIGGGTTVMSAVPEPSVWAMIILGFGAVGLALRTARRSGEKFDAKIKRINEGAFA